MLLNKPTNLVDIGVSRVDRLDNVIVVLLNLVLSLRVVVQEEHPIHHFVVVFHYIILSLGFDGLEVFVGLDKILSVGRFDIELVNDSSDIVGDLLGDVTGHVFSSFVEEQLDDFVALVDERVVEGFTLDQEHAHSDFERHGFSDLGDSGLVLLDFL
jgi:hypothetical protein